MAAHGAAVSLVQLLRQLSESVHFPKAEIESLHDKVFSLQSSLEKIFPVTKRRHRSRGKDLEVEIRDAVYEAEDAIESFLWRCECGEGPGDESSRSLLLADISASIEPIRAKAEKMAGEIGHGKDEGNNLSQLPRKSISGGTSTIVGQDEDKKLVMAELLNEADQLNVVLITGMPGIGKTTLARSLYDDASAETHFGVRAWVTVTQDYDVGQILTRLLNSIESKGEKPEFSQGSRVRELRVRLHQALFNTRYLIVMDDMWDLRVWDEVRNSMPDNRNESRLLVTTRISALAASFRSASFCHAMKPLGEEDSWTLLCEKTFGGTHMFPPHLENVGREIATNCRGLPLSLTVVGGLLSKETPSVDDWRVVERDTHAAAAKGDDSYLEILSLSYDHLPGRLKGCFLYMGAFPQDREILVSKLVMLWVAEGFLVPPSSPPQSMEMAAEKSLEELVDRNLLRICRRTSQGRIKTCDMHDSLRDLAMQQSGKEKFFHSVKTSNIVPTPDRSQRRVSIHMNLLVMFYQDLYDSTKSITAARTLLYAGHHHHHPMRSCLTFDLLRVLDACACYFIHFPNEVVSLVHLRYLSLTYGGALPSSLAKLQNLQVLIVRQEPKIINVDTTFLPDEIWMMPQLRHLLLAETKLPRIDHVHSYLPFANLQSLSDVHAASCTREVLRNMPNLKKLAMWIDTPGDVGLYLDELKQLEAFKFSVLNPVPEEKVEFQPKIFFPETLKKLTLRGCGLPWEDMEIIGKLPNLQVLKLRELAFQGEEWRPSPTCEFENLKFLLLEYVPLKIWDATSDHFPILESLILRHCYELEEISSDIGHIGTLQLIELVDCSADAVNCAEEISEEQKMYDNNRLHVRISSSWK